MIGFWWFVAGFGVGFMSLLALALAMPRRKPGRHIPICTGCGKVWPVQDDWEKGMAITRAHILGCEKHPLRLATDRARALEDLVQHCWLHSGYPDCGYKQMDHGMRRLYREAINRDDGEEPTA